MKKYKDMNGRYLKKRERDAENAIVISSDEAEIADDRCGGGICSDDFTPYSLNTIMNRTIPGPRKPAPKKEAQKSCGEENDGRKGIDREENTEKREL